MTHVLVTVSRGIIDQVTFFNSALPAVKALAAFVKGMNVQDDDAAVFGPKGLVVNAKNFLDENDEFFQNDQLVKEIAEGEEKPIYIIDNLDDPLGFMVESPDDLLGFEDPAEAVSELGQMRNNVGTDLKLYQVIPVENPIVSREELERYNEDAGVEDFPFPLVRELVIEPELGKEVGQVESDFEIAKWDRFFALYENGKLLCVTVYKTGAKAVERRIKELKAQLAEAQKGKPQGQDPKEVKHVE